MILHGNQQSISDNNAAFDMAALSVIGDREQQQDTFGYSLKHDEGLVVVCDGMGGLDGGKRASELATEVLLKEYAQNENQHNGMITLLEAAKTADTEITRLKNEKGRPITAGCTLVAVYVRQRELFWCSVGDSRAYLMRGGEIVQLTQDHTYRTVLMEKRNAGLIDNATFQAESVRGDLLISYLGIGNLSLIDYSESPIKLESGDRIIAMSDGLYKLLTDEETARITDNFANITEAVQALDAKAKNNAKKNKSLRDNATVAILEIK